MHTSYSISTPYIRVCAMVLSLARALKSMSICFLSLSLSQRENLSCTIEHDDEFFAVGWFYLIKKKRKKGRAQEMVLKKKNKKKAVRRRRQRWNDQGV